MTSSFVGGALSDRFGRRAMIALGYLWYAAIYGAFAWFTTLPVGRSSRFSPTGSTSG